MKITQNTITDNTKTIGNQTPKNSKTPITNGIKSANLKCGFTSPGSNHYNSLSPSDNGSISKFNVIPEKSGKTDKGHSIGRKGFEAKSKDAGGRNLQELKNTNEKTLNSKLNEKGHINGNKGIISKAVALENNKSNKQKMKKIANGKVEVIEDTQSTSNSSNASSSKMMIVIGDTKLNQGNMGKNKNEKIKIPEENKSTRSNKFDNGNGNGDANGNVMIKPLKLNTQLSSIITSLSSSISNNINNNVIDKEAELLKAMGWSENNSEDNIEIDENEINQIKKKWKEIVENRDVFRKNAREKFKQFISAAGEGNSKF